LQAAAGVAASSDRWGAGAAVQFRGLGGPAGVPGVVNAGGSLEEAGLWFSGNLFAPLAGPAGPVALAGIRWPVSDAFDLAASYSASFAADVAASLGGSARLGFSVRSDKGMAMDYTLVVPMTSGLGLTHLIGLGWNFGNRLRYARGPAAPRESPAIPLPQPQPVP